MPIIRTLSSAARRAGFDGARGHGVLLSDNLATDNGSYRPGSTAGSYGVQNAGYAQPAGTIATSPYGAGGAPTYGNTYTR